MDLLTSSLTCAERRNLEAFVQFITSEPAKELATVNQES